MQINGYGIPGQTYDFNLFDCRGLVWSGGGWVTWADANYQSYRIPAVEGDREGWYEATVPTGARGGLTRSEMRYRGITLEGSYLVWTGECGVEECQGSGGALPPQNYDGIAAEIATTAAGPASFQSDGQQATAQPLSELIKADQYLARKRVIKRRGFWGQVSMAKTIPPAAVDET